MQFHQFVSYIIFFVESIEYICSYHMWLSSFRQNSYQQKKNVGIRTANAYARFIPNHVLATQHGHVSGYITWPEQEKKIKKNVETKILNRMCSSAVFQIVSENVCLPSIKNVHFITGSSHRQNIIWMTYTYSLTHAWWQSPNKTHEEFLNQFDRTIRKCYRIPRVVLLSVVQTGLCCCGGYRTCNKYIYICAMVRISIGRVNNPKMTVWLISRVARVLLLLLLLACAVLHVLTYTICWERKHTFRTVTMLSFAYLPFRNRFVHSFDWFHS